MQVTLYHNTKCSKSRDALALLYAHGIQPAIVEYLKTPLTAQELTALISRLGIKPHALLRQSEREYKEYIAGRDLSDDAILALIARFPTLMERPVILTEKGGCIGRPPEKLLEFL